MKKTKSINSENTIRIFANIVMWSGLVLTILSIFFGAYYYIAKDFVLYDYYVQFNESSKFYLLCFLYLLPITILSAILKTLLQNKK